MHPFTQLLLQWTNNLSEEDGRGDQEGHLVRDGGFFEVSWGQRFHQDETSVRHVCGCCGLETGVC